MTMYLMDLSSPVSLLQQQGYSGDDSWRIAMGLLTRIMERDYCLFVDNLCYPFIDVTSNIDLAVRLAVNSLVSYLNHTPCSLSLVGFDYYGIIRILICGNNVSPSSSR